MRCVRRRPRRRPRRRMPNTSSQYACERETERKPRCRESGICAKGLCAPSPREAEPAAPQPVLGVRRHVCPVWSCSGLRRACHPKRKATFLEVLPRSVGRADRTSSRCSRGSPSDIISLQQRFVIGHYLAAAEVRHRTLSRCSRGSSSDIISLQQRFVIGHYLAAAEVRHRTLSRCSRGSSSDIISLQQRFVIIPMWPPIFRSSAKRAAVGAHSRAAAPTAVALAAALAATATTATPSMAAAAALNVASCFALRHRGNEWPFRQFGRGNEWPFRQFGRGNEWPFRQFGRGNEWPFRQFGRGNEWPFRRFGPFRQYGR